MVACKKWPATQRWENLLPAGPVDAWDVRLPPKNLEGAWPQAKDELSSTSSNKEKPCGTMADSSGSLRPIRPLNVITRYRTGEADLELSLRIRLPPTWDVKTVLEAIIEPFVQEYDRRHPDDPASAHGPFTRVKVLVWAGPTASGADSFRKESRDHIEDIRSAERPLWCLLDTSDAVKALRERGHNMLRPTVELELVNAQSTALVVRTTPSSTLLAVGETLMAMLQDTSSDPEEMHQMVDAAIARGELAYLGLTSARDRHGRNALHLAVTRGDCTLCRKLLQRREDVFAMDSNRDMAIHIAALAGRQLIVRDLLELGACIHEKNRDLMLPLNLACVDEAQGNGEVIRMLVEAGADIDAKCWDITPIMAAANGGHHWAIESLLELGADINIRNGYEMMALDYARDQDTAQLLYDVMRGFLLPDPKTVAEQEASRKRRQANARTFGGFNFDGIGAMPDVGPAGAKDKGPRLFQAHRKMPLSQAFHELGISQDWLPSFRESGEHYSKIRYAWRQAVLNSHPDRQPSSLTEAEAATRTADYMRVMAAFETVDAFHAVHHAKPVEQAWRKGGHQAAGGDSRGGGEGGGGGGAARDISGAASFSAKPSVSACSHGEENSACSAAKISLASGEAPVELASKSAKNAVSRARLAPLFLHERVELVDLQARPELNGKRGKVTRFDRGKQRYAVEMDNRAGSLQVRVTNLKLLTEDEEHQAEERAHEHSVPPVALA